MSKSSGGLVPHSNKNSCKSEGDGKPYVKGQLSSRGKGVGEEPQHIQGN